MDFIVLNDIRYRFVSNFKEDQKIRASFNELAKATFGIHFESWYTSGYWGDNYIPFALVHHGKVVANVSVNKMEFLMENEQKTGIQIGTVMTDREYRGRGLSKFLFEHVIEQWKEKTDFVYLFANEDVLDFYPKFNFEAVAQYQFSKPVKISDKTSSARKLNMTDDSDKELLVQSINDSIPVAGISMLNNLPLLMFYCLSVKKDCIFYLEKLKAVVIANIEGDVLHLNDLFSKAPVSLDEVIQFMADKTIKKVVLGFTPLDIAGYQKSILNDGDTLFILKDQLDHFKNKEWMFPVLSHA